MSPSAGSRYSFCLGVRDEAGRLFLTEREPYGFHPHPDNRTHVVVQGDTLWGLAGRYFAPVPRACGYWWAIANYQPEGGIVDPTIELELGSVVHAPSLRVLTDIILGESSRRADG